jgi:hypothetical protein
MSKRTIVIVIAVTAGVVAGRWIREGSLQPGDAVIIFIFTLLMGVFIQELGKRAYRRKE